MKNICIVTICNGSNFGNRLQNYALQYVLEQCFGAKVATARNVAGEIGGKYLKHAPVYKLVQSAPITGLACGFLKKGRLLKKFKFLRFNRKYIHFTDDSIDVDRVPDGFGHRYDHFIVGSDQVWNPQMPFNSSVEYLCFAPSHKRIAYAASFGISELSQEDQAYTTRMLRGFGPISVREHTGLEILKKSGRSDGTVVLDPTLLLTAEEWAALERKPGFIKDEDPYLLSYLLDTGNEPAHAHARQLCSENGWKLIDINDPVQYARYGIGPDEFLYLIHHAAHVCTDSFHASVFSTLFHRDFTVFTRGKMNSRIVSLLDIVSGGREMRWVDGTCVPHLDHELADSLICQEREHSLAFLKKSLEASVSAMPKLADPDLCNGCSACASICPKGCLSMEPDGNGFLHPTPTHPENCINCGRCTLVCPVLQPPRRLPKPTAWAAYSRNSDLRFRSSSGGVFSELAVATLANGGAVFGAAYDPDFRVVHTCVERTEELVSLRGAKYAQSDITGTFRDVKARLDSGQKVLFSGTPCQVGGLLSFLGREHPNLLTVDFVCHGVPSPLVWERYVEYMSKDNPLAAIDLRSKETGWSRYRYSNAFVYQNGERVLNSSGDSLYMKLFVGDAINRLSCQSCRFKGAARPSDITLGDFWGIWDLDPEMDDDRGTSLVLVQSPKGTKVLEQIRDQLVLKEVPLASALQSNPSALVSSAAHPRRSEILKQLRSGKFDDCTRLLSQDQPSFLKKGCRKAKKVLRILMRKG